MVKNFIYAICSILLVSFNLAQAAGDPVAGKEKAQTCTSCHGPEGKSAMAIWPHIAGQSAEYIEKQLADFKSGKRENAQMAPFISSLNEQDFADIAAYFSSVLAPTGMAKADSIILGEEIYRAGNAKTGLSACMACHGPNGAGNPAAKYPKISGQYAEYTASQLQSFKAEERINDQNKMMQSVSRKMTDEEIEAVSQYIQGLR